MVRPAAGRCLASALALISPLLLSAGARAGIEHQNIAEEAPPPAPSPILTKAPELLTFVNAPYPPELQAREVSGNVVLYIDIDERGVVSRVEVVSSDHPLFNLPAMVAATQFVFSPGEVDYEPAPIRIEYRYRFEAEVPPPDIIAGLPIQADNDAGRLFRGMIREAGSRDPVAGATIFVNEIPKGETGPDGAFEVPVPEDQSFAVKVHAPHHHPYKVRESDPDSEVTYYIYRSALDPYETVVRTKKEQREVTQRSLNRRELSRVAGTAGDPIRVLENLPGMGRPQGGLGALLIRGSSPQDSQVFIDGMPVPMLYHFGGLVSVLSRYMIESIDVVPGAFPARYGNAVAGVVDVKTRELDCDKWRGATEPSTALVNAYTCYPLSENFRIAAAGRRSLLDLYLPEILKAVQSETNAADEGAIIVTPAYADYQLKIEGKLGDHTLTLFAFGSDDDANVFQTPSAERAEFNFGYHQGFHRVMLRHQWRPTEGLSITTSAAPGVSLAEFALASDNLNLRGTIYDYNVALREDISWQIGGGFQLRLGFDGTFGFTDVDFETPMPEEFRQFPSPIFNFGENHILTYDLPMFNHAYWLDGVITPGGGVEIVPGVRFSRFDFHRTQAYAVEPRINARWQFLEGMTIKAAYGWHERLPNVENLLEAPFGNHRLRPHRTHQFIVGYRHDFTDLINLDVQAYYYLREQVTAPSLDVRYRDGALSPVGWLNTGAGETIGLEVLLRHEATPPRDYTDVAEITDLESFLDAMRGRFYGWIAYTLSQTMVWDRTPGATYTLEQGPGIARTFPYDPRLNQPYLAPFDQTHILTIVAQMMLPLGIEAGLRFRLVSGNPYTPQHAGFIGVDADRDAYQVDLSNVPRNSARIAMFHQLDLRFDKDVLFDLFKVNVYLEVTNVYAANNVDQVQYDYRYRGQITTNILPFPLAVLGAIVKW